MRFRHREHPDRLLRLGYCLNLHPARTLAEFLGGLEGVAGALAARLRPTPDEPFGIGMYLPAHVAFVLSRDAGARAEVGAVLARGAFDPFTWNAFPFGRFHEAGLKADVFRPTWLEPERAAYTLAVAELAAGFASELAPSPEDRAPRHLSISTHTGGFGTHVSGPRERAGVQQALLGVVRELARLEEESGWRIVLSLEAEPRASAGDTGELRAFLAELQARAPALLDLPTGAALDLVRRHLGTCLDTCHAAVEFEEPATAWCNSTADGTPLGKLQFTSALALRDPGRSPAARTALLGLQEPIYLHQTNGQRGTALMRANDLPELERALEEPDSPWLECSEWRCHFHVPVDREAVATGGLGTTRAVADDLLALALAEPAAWGTNELHVEIETYTWSILPGRSHGPDELVLGLEREYRHVLAHLATRGWEPAPKPLHTPDKTWPQV